MKIKIAQLSVFLSMLVIGCQKDGVPVDSGGGVLESRIVGRWDGSGHKILFNSDKTFIDSAFSNLQFDSTVMPTDTIIFTGKFEIKDGLLYPTEIHCAFSSTWMLNLEDYPSEKDVSIIGEKLYLKPVYAFDPVGTNSGQLFGNCRRQGWYCRNSNGNSLNTLNGEYLEEYSFVPDSTKCSQTIEYLTGIYSPKITRYVFGYTYQQPNLNIASSGYDNIDVEFKFGKMLWYMKYGLLELAKSK